MKSFYFQEVKVCTMIFDGYFTETVIFTLIGIVWLYWAKKSIYNMEDMDTSEWMVELESTRL